MTREELLDAMIATRNGSLVMTGVREHDEEYPVQLSVDGGRFVVVAKNEADYSSTWVDLEDVIKWVGENAPWMLHPSTSRG